MTTAPTPELLFQTLNAYQRTAALKTAIELDVFSAIHEGAQTAPAIADRVGASVRGTRILCDFLALLGLITKTGDQYALTPDTAVFLVRQSPAYMGGTLRIPRHRTRSSGISTGSPRPSGVARCRRSPIR